MNVSISETNEKANKNAPSTPVSNQPKANQPPNVGVPTNGKEDTVSLGDCFSSVFHTAQRAVRQHGGVKSNRASVGRIVAETQETLTKQASPCAKSVSEETILALSFTAMSVP